MNHTPRTATATIDLSALRHNLLLAKSLAPESKILAVIKANAYGHDMLNALPALCDADALAVAHVSEGEVLRAHIDKPIVVLQGFADVAQWQMCHQLALTPVVHDPHQLHIIETAQLAHANKPMTVWLKMNTGMNRLGFLPDDFSFAFNRLLAVPHIREVVAMTHMACADDVQDTFTHQQQTAFQNGLSTVDASLQCSVDNSAMILRADQIKSDWVRPGIMLYGVNPFVADAACPSLHHTQLKPVMTLRSNIIARQSYHAGERIGYGGDWQCEVDADVAVVAVGYGDGYPRHARSGTPILVNGQRAPLVGRVSMDMIAVDVSGISNCQVGDEVILWGQGLPVEEVAQYAGTIAYELLCSVSARVPKTYLPAT